MFRAGKVFKEKVAGSFLTYWKKEFQYAIHRYNDLEELWENPISINKAEKVNIYLLAQEGSCGIVCEFDDYLTYFDEKIHQSLGLSKNSPCIAMNIDTFTDHLAWTKHSPLQPVVDRNIAKTGLLGLCFGIPIVVNNNLKGKITNMESE